MKDLPKTTNTVRRFHAQIKNVEKWTMTKITGFKIKDFRGSNALWNYVMDNASLRSYIAHHDQSGLSHPNHKEKMGENDNIHNIIFTT